MAPDFERAAQPFDVDAAEGYQLSLEGVDVLSGLVEERIVPRVQQVIESLEEVSLPVENRRLAERFLDALKHSLQAVAANPKVFFLGDLKSRAFGETDVLSEDLELAACRVGYDLYS